MEAPVPRGSPRAPWGYPHPGPGDLPEVLLGFAGIAVLVGVFLIVNTFSMLVAQRTREIGLLRAVGSSRRQVDRA